MVVVVDPFNKRSSDSFLFSEIDKLRISARINKSLWKYTKFREESNANIIIGDSRMNLIKAELVHEITGESYFNLSFGGATIPEIVHTFWYAQEIKPSKNVFIGISFGIYNALKKRNRALEAEEISSSWAAYAVNQSVLKSTAYLLHNKLTGIESQIGVPNMSKAAYWDYELTNSSRILYSDYVYPQNFLSELKNIVAYCEMNKISLTFVIPPIHIDLQDKIHEYGRSQELSVFKKDLKELGSVYDFHTCNELTLDRNNFRDPFHAEDEAVRIVIMELFNLKQ